MRAKQTESIREDDRLRKKRQCKRAGIVSRSPPNVCPFRVVIALLIRSY